LSLAGQVAIITGGTRGIGKAIVEEMIANSVRVAFVYRHDQAAAEALCRAAAERGGEAVGFQQDVTDFAGAKDVVAATQERFGRVDMLVNNAGITRDKLFVMMPEEDWRAVIETNLYGTINFARAAIYTFMKQKSGRIVNVASVSGQTGLPGQANYSASKAGIIGFSKALAKEVAKIGITVNVVSPGFIDTEMVEAIPEKIRTQLLATIPTGRLGRAQEVARAVKFFLSEDAAYITGQVLTIDGGLYT
jgi:3-oxoacyl-[acyl-carrier protein] reductase